MELCTETLTTSRSLHARVRAMVDAFEKSPGTDVAPGAFDALACDIARHQAASIAGFARLCRARNVDPATLTLAEQIPAVPTDAFKITRVAAFPADDATAVFRTSGTTVGTRGEHALRDVSTYDAAAIAFGRHWLARDLGQRVPVVVLGRPPSVTSDSSLMHMCEAFRHAFGIEASPEQTYLLDDDGVLDLDTFDERVARALALGQPMLVLGTSFAFVHLVDGIGSATFHLPPGSRVMQTGGYKGRTREVPPDVLRSDLARVFGLDGRAIISEYGMTELGSQFYERTLFDARSKVGVYAEPPWARVVPVDPETLERVPEGAVGIAKIIDLVNVDSAVAVLTQDRVRRVGQGKDAGFELLGRLPGATPRGCSIAIEELLGRGNANVDANADGNADANADADADANANANADGNADEGADANAVANAKVEERGEVGEK